MTKHQILKRAILVAGSLATVAVVATIYQVQRY